LVLYYKMEIKYHILVVDDDTRLRELLQNFLMDNGFSVTTAMHANDAMNKIALFQFDLIVLDVMMPYKNGLEFALELKASNSSTPPILLLTAMSETEDRINGLVAGADDYLVKPFEPRELVLRIKAILRRTGNNIENKNQVQFGDYVFDINLLRLQKNGELVSLTTGEGILLKALTEKSPEAVSRSELALIMGIADNERSIDVQITRLRKKIEPDNSRPLYIQTMRGAGYAIYTD
jgi:two-component system, OmpR family, phosphate regulon response regulator OmpR